MSLSYIDPKHLVARMTCGAEYGLLKESYRHLCECGEKHFIPSQALIKTGAYHQFQDAYWDYVDRGLPMPGSSDRTKADLKTDLKTARGLTGETE